MVDTHLAFNKLLMLGVEIRLVPVADGIDIILRKHWGGELHVRRIHVHDFLTVVWLDKVWAAGSELGDVLIMKG